MFKKCALALVVLRAPGLKPIIPNDLKRGPKGPLFHQKDVYQKEKDFHQKQRLAVLNICGAVLCATLVVLPLWAGARPRYGGTVHLVLQHRVNSVLPTDESESSANQARIGPLIFETLTQIDMSGHLRPGLATSWQAEAGGRVWQFQLRTANFHSGTSLSAATVAASLRVASPDWKVSVNGRETVTIETPG